VIADALKIVLAPVFVVAITLVARRYGSRIGGVVGGLPAIAGPILFVLALDHGRAFAADAAVGTLLGVLAVMAFVAGYVLVSSRFDWPVAVLGGWAGFFVAVGVLQPTHVDAYVALAIAFASTTATIVFLPRPAPGAASEEEQPRGELAVRALCALLPVVVITATAHLLGPHLSGLLASFPVMTPVLAGFTQSRHGPQESARPLHGLATGFYSYGLFCFVVAIGVEDLGIAGAFGLAAAVSLAVQAIALVVTGRQERSLVLEV
jgi:hypothetical protein